MSFAPSRAVALPGALELALTAAQSDVSTAPFLRAGVLPQNAQLLAAQQLGLLGPQPSLQYLPAQHNTFALATGPQLPSLPLLQQQVPSASSLLQVAQALGAGQLATLAQSRAALSLWSPAGTAWSVTAAAPAGVWQQAGAGFPTLAQVRWRATASARVAASWAEPQGRADCVAQAQAGSSSSHSSHIVSSQAEHRPLLAAPPFLPLLQQQPQQQQQQQQQQQPLQQLQQLQQQPQQQPQQPQQPCQPTAPAAEAASVPSAEKAEVACSECGKVFARRARLHAHLRLHSGEKPFECRLGCGMRFADSSNRRRHEAAHRGRRVLRCEKCNTRFPKKAALAEHVATCGK
jgi:hypothetical protein